MRWQLALCKARPQAISRAKPGRNDSFMAALARLALSESQSQAVRPWLFGEQYKLWIIANMSLLINSNVTICHNFNHNHDGNNSTT